nr:DUF4062 domain-containing protein [Alcaligenes faecalis]
MSKKYQIFVSSTYQDLRDERDQVIKATLEMGHIPVGMEMFSAADEEQWAIITRQIDQSDYYVLVIAHRYGSMATDGISYTEKEYDYAVAKGIPVLGFVIDDSAPWPKDKQEEEIRSLKRLTEFKKKVKGRLVQFWSNKEELHGRVSIALTKAITAYPRTGWARADEVSGPEVTRELIRLSSENANLRIEIEALRRIKDGQEDEVRTVIQILSSNSRTFKIRKTPQWTGAKSYTVSIADIFHYCALNLINENTKLGVAQNIALKITGTNYYSEWPIGSNVASEIIADFAALDLIEPSKKKHSVSDKNEYWALTKLGKQVLKDFRRVRLEQGLGTNTEPDGDGN